MAENTPETPQVKNIWPDFGGYVDDWSREAYSAGLKAGIRRERARCAAHAHAVEGLVKHITHGVPGIVAQDACLDIAEAIERGDL